MRHIILSIVTLLWATQVAAFEVEEHHRFGMPDASQELRIISTADVQILIPLMNLFLAKNPDVVIDYTSVSSGDLMKAVVEGEVSFDLALSSAMDLQIKLANDGYSLRHRSDATQLVPEWGNWRDHVFAFSQEEASIVVSPAAFDDIGIPRDRQSLIDALRRHPERFAGRVATYDLTLSGTGYLFATQDARTSDTYWRLMEVMGSLDAQLFCCSAAMIEAVARGDVAVAYNVLGSYARARQDLDGLIEIVDPADFTNMMLRTAILLHSAQDQDLAGAFIDHLLQSAWGEAEVPEYPFHKWHLDTSERAAAARPIRLGPGLMVFLDDLKRNRFLKEWFDAVQQE